MPVTSSQFRAKQPEFDNYLDARASAVVQTAIAASAVPLLKSSYDDTEFSGEQLVQTRLQTINITDGLGTYQNHTWQLGLNANYDIPISNNWEMSFEWKFRNTGEPFAYEWHIQGQTTEGNSLRPLTIYQPRAWADRNSSGVGFRAARYLWLDPDGNQSMEYDSTTDTLQLWGKIIVGLGGHYLIDGNNKMECRGPSNALGNFHCGYLETGAGVFLGSVKVDDSGFIVRNPSDADLYGFYAVNNTGYLRNYLNSRQHVEYTFAATSDLSKTRYNSQVEVASSLSVVGAAVFQNSTIIGAGDGNNYISGTTFISSTLNGASARFSSYVMEKPPSSVTPFVNGEIVTEFTNNTTLTLKGRGSDGVVRSIALTIA